MSQPQLDDGSAATDMAANTNHRAGEKPVGPEKRPPTRPSAGTRPVLLVIAILLVWGAIHTTGIFLSEEQTRVGLIKGLIVFCSMSLFLGGWALLLLGRRTRQRRLK